MEFTRSFPLDDISVRSGGDGRTVEAYATVFNTPAEVRDADGEYIEMIDPTAFNDAIGRARNAKGGWNIPVIFNHGMTLYHTPSERDSAPIGVVEDIVPDKRGLLTRARYLNTPRADEILENIRAGSISAYSFSGVFRKSNPPVPRAGFRRDRDGNLPTVRRMISTLREFGPATFPVYSGAEVVGVRAEQVAAMIARMERTELDRLASAINASGSLLDQPDADSSDDEPVAEDQPAGQSVRSPRQQILERYAEFIRRSA